MGPPALPSDLPPPPSLCFVKHAAMSCTFVGSCAVAVALSGLLTRAWGGRTEWYEHFVGCGEKGPGVCYGWPSATPRRELIQRGDLGKTLDCKFREAGLFWSVFILYSTNLKGKTLPLREAPPVMSIPPMACFCTDGSQSVA